MTRRTCGRVEGTVQGVGFRPYVYRLAREEGLAGYVLNDERGVVLDVEGAVEAVERFVARLPAEAPPLAAIESVAWTPLPPTGDRGFRILDSAGNGRPAAPVTADAATCDDCLAELFDPADRRFRYPFVNCTNCGPRFTIVRGVPYDRPLTTMAGFAMCERCRAEYDDPADRRFHAQPNACPECGPTARLGEATGDDAMHAAAAALLDGAIVAVKGLGGYHLACRADDQAAVARLRARKQREERPFALMAPDLDAARTLVALGEVEAALLCGRERPIVLAARRPGASVAAAVAPRSAELGVMLPYSPLHHLLAVDAGTTLVMTSGNASDEPIAYRDDDALERLAGIADHVLLHDRPIRTRTDDSVVRAVRGRALMLRRSRGHVPGALALPLATPDLLACGAELKSTFCVAKGTRAWVGHHIGDLRNAETLESFTEGVAHFEALFAVAPTVVAHDLHPDYLSTAYALARDGVTHVGVQHHHAHLAAVLAEHGECGPAMGAIYDGTGYGPDATVWGGELLAGDLDGFERAGHLWPVRMPGGDRAVRQPWRMACAWLAEALGAEPAPLPGIEPRTWHAVAELARTGLAAPLTTSMGRLFDAVAALCGVCAEVSYEGQAAIELEAISDRAERGAYPLDVAAGVLDARVTVAAVAHDVAAGVEPSAVGARFHRAVAGATAQACAEAAAARRLDTVVLAGGVWQNRLLLELTTPLLEHAGLRVLVPERLPPNDGAISFGQAAVAAARGHGEASA
jgi:hydrogenase maturation protein HypF